MLVLTRKLDESIIINDNIRIKVIGLKGGSVRIGIDAPPSVSIRREELDAAPVRPNCAYSSQTEPASTELEDLGVAANA